MLMTRFFPENLFDDFFDFPDFGNMDRQLEKKLYGHHAANVMKCDVKDHDDNYEVVIDLPGFTKDEINAQVENGYLTISAAKGIEKDEKEKKGEKFIRKERYEGSCQRSFYVGENIKQEDIKAKFEHGVLTLLVPKKAALPETKTNRILIE